MKKILVTLVALLLIVVCTAQAGGPVVKVRPAPPPLYVPVVVQPAPAPLPLWNPPRMKAFVDLTVYMTDYKAILRQSNYPGFPAFPAFNFGEAFGWNTKEAVTELSVGAVIPGFVEGGFTWIMPVERSGSGIPTVPIVVGGYTFGPRAADTIAMKTKLSGERVMLSTPRLFDSRRLMPALMGEWWHLNANVNGTPNVATTSQAPVDVRQNFNKLIFGMGVVGETTQRPIRVTYKAFYTTGGHTAGFLAEAGVGWKQENLAAGIGYRYSVRTISFSTGDFHMDTNGPWVNLTLYY
mgnify:CR=1 FL=1